MFYLNLNRVYLREFMMSDLLDVYEYCSNPNVGPNAGWKEHKSIEETRRILISMINEKDNFAIVNKTNNKVIGSIGLYKDFKRENPYCKMIGYVLNESYWGKGIMTEAVKQLCEYVFSHTDIIRIYAEPFAHNIGSCRVLEKAGFQHEGTLRSNAVKNGELLDMKMYARLRKEV